MVGKISWYNDRLGFGFITPLQGGDRYYFETTQRELFSLEQTVAFETKRNPQNGRLIAVDVKPADSTDSDDSAQPESGQPEPGQPDLSV